MNVLPDLRELVADRERLAALVAVVVAVLIVIGELLFVVFSILPQMRSRTDLIPQVASAEQELRNAQEAQAILPEQLKQEVATAEAALSDATSSFFSEEQAADILNRLYRYADDSGVEITDLRAQPGPKPKEKSVYDVKTLRIQVTGPLPQLMDFVSRIEEATYPTFVITNVNISSTEGTHVLTMDITLYTSPYSPGTLVQVTPTLTPVLTPTLPAQVEVRVPTVTPSPTLSMVEQLALRLEEVWDAENWQEAIVLIQQIRAIDPEYNDMVGKLYTAHVKYGHQLAAEGRLEEAKDEFTRALTLRPDGEEALSGLQGLAAEVLTPTPTPGPTPTPTPPTEYVVYVVRRGDTLFSIARRYGTTVGAIMAANGLTSSTIYTGQRLLIPTSAAPPPYIIHVVRPGDTLFSIARRYGTTVGAIMAANGLRDTTIYVGQRLRIPTR